MENPQSFERQEFPDRSRRFLLAAGVLMVLLIAAAVGGYTWIALFGPCTVSTVQTASNALLDQLHLFDAMYQSIPSLTPVELFDPMTHLQRIFIDTQKVVVPACLQLAQSELIIAMESVIRALLAVMESKPETAVTGLFEKSTTHLDNFRAELKWIDKCAPFCP